MTPTVGAATRLDCRRNRRLRALLIAAMCAALGTAFGPPAASSPNNHGSQQHRNQQHGHDEYLVAADPAADALYVYRTSDMKRTGQLDDIELASHAGTLQLPDGRLVFVDDQNAEVVAVRITNRGRPRIANAADIPGEGWSGALWAAADRKLRYFAFTGGEEGATQSVTVVDLKTFDIEQIEVDVEPDASGSIAETHVFLAGRPRQLVFTTGGKFQTVGLADVMAGQSPAVTSTAPVRSGTHGPVVSRSGDYVFSTTAEGFDGAAIRGTRLGSTRNVDYSPTRNVVQNYRPRLATDARTVWGAASEDTGLTAEEWVDTRNNFNVIDTSTFRSALVRLPDGLASRLALSARYGAVSTIHPDGDVLTLIDTDRSSSTYRRIVGTVGLPSSTDGPVAGRPTAGTQGHFPALDASGRRAFVSNGGDGLISVINLKSRQLVDTLSTPTALTGGGYLTVVRAGTPTTDLVAR